MNIYYKFKLNIKEHGVVIYLNLIYYIYFQKKC
jgi:hypothetical protein